MKFVIYGPSDVFRSSGSAVIRGGQVVYALQHKNIPDIKFQCIQKLPDIHDSFVVCVKDNRLDINGLKILKKHNNKIIFDVLDYYDIKTHDTPDIIKNGFNEYIDMFVVNNEYMRKEFEKYKKPIYVIPHHYDIRLNKVDLKKNTELKFIFNGYRGATNRNCLYLKELKQHYNLIENELFLNFMNKMLASNYCFVSIREEGSWEFNNRPGMKLAHAAACDSNIIITNDMSVRDLLDPSYPYLLKDSKYETVVEMMEYVKKTFNTDVWFHGLKIMKDLKQKLSVDQVAENYWLPMIKDLSVKENK